MLKLDKNTVDFLVTSGMVNEVESFLKNGAAKTRRAAEELVAKAIERVYFVGCGSSKAVGDAGKYMFDKYSTMPCDAYTGWEFADNTPKALDSRSAVILISHSGKTEEVVEALRKANSKGALTIAVVNQAKGNPLGEEAVLVLDYDAHAMWECQLLSVYMTICAYIQRTSPDAEIARLMEDIPKLPQVLRHHIESFEDKALHIAEGIAYWKGFYTIAAGPLRSLAYKEGVITNMEFMWGHGAVIESGEFRHGPLEITDDRCTFVFLLGTDASRHTTERALSFVKRYNGQCVVLDYNDFSMGLHPELAPMVMFVPLEWFSYYFAIVRDHNPDERRYYNVVEY